MSSSNAKEPSALGNLLRQWRAARRTSQLALSLETGVSQRHISFIESGRSVPGRDTLMLLAVVLDVPLRDRNALLLAAGYAPMYSEAAWDSAGMGSVNRALARMLRQHDPYPAMVMDRHWNVLTTNDSAPRFFNGFVDMAARKGTRNILHLMFDPAGMRPFIAGWEQVARSLLQRVAREAVGGVMDDTSRALLNALLAYPDVAPAWQTAGDHGAGDSLQLFFDGDDRRHAADDRRAGAAGRVPVPGRRGDRALARTLVRRPAARALRSTRRAPAAPRAM
jgi:transcriptional regulator with XRE-family HTH domain